MTKRTPVIMLAIIIYIVCNSYAKDGVVKEYNKSGVLLSETTYVNGKKNGPYKEYSANKSIAEEGNYKDDKKDGLWMQYGSKDFREEINWKDGKLNGLDKMYHKDGNVIREVNWKEGKRDGMARFYYDNGSVDAEARFKDGKFDGFYRSYDKNGNCTRECARKNARYPKEKKEKAVPDLEKKTGTVEETTDIDLSFESQSNISEEEKDKLIERFYDEDFFDIKVDSLLLIWEPSVEVIDVTEGRFIDKPGKQRAILFSENIDYCNSCNEIVALKIAGEDFKWPLDNSIVRTIDLGYYEHNNRTRIKAVKIDPSRSLDQILIRSNLAPNGSGNIEDTLTLLQWNGKKYDIIWQHLVEEWNSANRGGEPGWCKADVKYNKALKQIEVSSDGEHMSAAGESYSLHKEEIYRRSFWTGKYKLSKQTEVKKKIEHVDMNHRPE